MLHQSKRIAPQFAPLSPSLMPRAMGHSAPHRPMVSPCGPLVAHIDCSRGWKSLKQNPSFFEGRSMSSHVLSSTVPHQWPL